MLMGMAKIASTPDRILSASLRLFNEYGFTKTTVAKIAQATGITEGNLWYHFRTKDDLVAALFDDAYSRFREHMRSARSLPDPFDRYATSVYGCMSEMWSYRFLEWDRLQFQKTMPKVTGRRVVSLQDEQFNHLKDLLVDFKEQGHFEDADMDVETLAISLWTVTRYWWNYLHDREQVTTPMWAHQVRGFQQHLSIVLPHLRPAAQAALKAAGDRHLSGTDRDALNVAAE
jgi:AcrR family transcriptional regulator